MPEAAHTLDTLIVGGGPAGLSAALHLAFHGRDVLVVDRRTGPLPYTLTPLWNVPGFPGRSGLAIIAAMRAEAAAMGARLVGGSVVGLEREPEGGFFRARLESGEALCARTVLLASGVARHHPLVGGDYRPWLKFAAKGNSYYCPDCEAPELLGRDIVVIGVGGANAAAASAVPLAEFARSVRLLLTGGSELKPEWAQRTAALGVEATAGSIAAVEGRAGLVGALVLEDGRRVVADGYYVAGPKRPRSALALSLGLETGQHGHILTGSRGQTRIEGLWAAGDVQPQTQQISIAAGSGNIAAVMIDQHLTRLAPRRLGRAPGAAFRPGWAAVAPETAPATPPS